MKNYYSFWFAAFVIACGVDFLFWGKPIGVSFPLWVLLVMSSAIYLAWKTKMRPARENLFSWSCRFWTCAFTFIARRTFLRK